MHGPAAGATAVACVERRAVEAAMSSCHLGGGVAQLSRWQRSFITFTCHAGLHARRGVRSIEGRLAQRLVLEHGYFALPDIEVDKLDRALSGQETWEIRLVERRLLAKSHRIATPHPAEVVVALGDRHVPETLHEDAVHVQAAGADGAARRRR